jgi:hypothetical protein
MPVEALARPLIRIRIAPDGTFKVPLDRPRPSNSQPASVGRILQGDRDTYDKIWIRICVPNDSNPIWVEKVSKFPPRNDDFYVKRISVGDVLLMAWELGSKRDENRQVSETNRLYGVVVEKTDKELVLVRFASSREAFDRLRDVRDIPVSDLPAAADLDLLVRHTEAELAEIVRRSRALEQEYHGKREQLFDAFMLRGRRKKLDEQ